jgi:pimeloyl-ACP methyl ester carboxylesterase
MGQIARNGDVRLAWESTGDGPPVLLIHGLGYARWGWEPLAPLLAVRHRVIAFDNRGIGASDAPAGPYAVADMAADALAVLDAAGIATAHVVGTSLGGMVAQELAATAPERVDRLVLLCTTPGTSGHPMPAATLRLMAEAASLPPEVRVRRFVENALGAVPDPAIVEAIVAHRVAAPQAPAAWAAQAAAGAAFDIGARLHAIVAPTLLLHGTSDRVVDPRNSELLAERLPDVRLAAAFEGAGHLFFWERPSETAALILEHLADAGQAPEGSA